MATIAKKKAYGRRRAPTETAVIYRGIRIDPMPGRRSPLARAIRDGLKAKQRGQARGEAAPA